MGFRETWADIDLDALQYNYEHLGNKTCKEIFGVVKANAYGHGDVVIAKHLETIGAKILCVSSIDEAERLVHSGIQTDILIFSYVNPEAILKRNRPQYIYTVPSMAWYNEIATMPSLRLHIEVNTGMNRYGIKSIEDVKTIMAQHKVEGIYTHFQSPDNHDEGRKQLARFKGYLDALNHSFEWVHVGNAPTELIRDESWINGARLGLGLYGYRVDFPELKPILSLYSTIRYVESVEPGETVGYDYTYAVNNHEIIGTMPIGYADSFDIRNAQVPVWIHEKPYDIIGKICMDQTMIRIDDTIQVGDVVELIGPHRNSKLIHEKTGIMTYIQLSTLSDRIERRYLMDGVVVQVVVR